MPIQFKHIHKPLEEDLIVEYLESDKTFVENRKEDFKNFTNQYFPNQSIFMTLKQQYINFAHLITKNALVATVLMLLVLTTVSVSAAELFAPDEFKPSTIFNLKSEIKQSDQSTGISSSSSSSSSEVSVISSSSETSQVSAQSSSSAPKTQKVVNNPNPTNNIYTNNLVPDLKINYTGWSIEKNEDKVNMIYCRGASSPESLHPCHKIYFRKNGGEINITIQSTIEGTPADVKDFTKINEKLFRAIDENGKWVYSKTKPATVPCYYPEENTLCLNKALITSEFTINQQGYGLITNISFSGDPSLLPEVDQMVLNSGIQF